MAGDPQELRLTDADLGPLSDRLAAGRAALLALGASLGPTRGDVIVRVTTALVDEMVAGATRAARARILEERGSEAAQRADQVTLIALGSYGRREMCPRSDVDVSFLVPEGGAAQGDPAAALVNGVLYALWDLGFEVGHAVRTVAESVRLAVRDQSVLSSMLDARLIDTADGESADLQRSVFDGLMKAIEDELHSGTKATDLVRAKLQELEKRRTRFGSTIYLLEPNVKESDGGLRELHSALWIARARWRVGTVAQLAEREVLAAREARALERAYGFLLRVRAQIHMLAGRRQDILGFAHQEQIAEKLGYLAAGEVDQDRRTHGVERFMRAYYFHASQIRYHAQLVVERATSHRPRDGEDRTAGPEGFTIQSGMLAAPDPQRFLEEPARMVRLFRVAQEEALEIYSYTKNEVREAAGAIDREVRRRPEVVRDFIAILEDPKADGSILDVMHDVGVLRRLIPELGRVTARWQHSLYHVYTVDVHSLTVVKIAKRLRGGAYSDTQRELTRLISDLPRPQVVYLAALLHDIGKGWPRGDHSKRGAKVARAVGARLEAPGLPQWTREDTEDLSWLVLEHLAMSEISQRRDVSDRHLIEAFADNARSVERLTMLYILTFADMLGTSPKVWTDWKGILLKELYDNTRAVLVAAKSGEIPEVASHEEARRRRAREEMLAEAERRPDLGLDAEVVRAFASAMPSRYMVSFPARRMLRHIEMWRDLSQTDGLAIHVTQLHREDITKLTVVCSDRPGLLSLLAGTLAANRLQIMSALIFSIDRLAADPASDPGDGLDVQEKTYDLVVGGTRWSAQAAVDVLYVKDESGNMADDPQRWRQVRRDLEAVILGGKDVGELLTSRLGGSMPSRRHKPHVKTELVISNEVSKQETVIDVFCQDHLGALYTISKALADQRLSISLAKISTQGDRVADGFYVTDADTGRKVEDKDRLSRIREAIAEAIHGVRTTGAWDASPG